MNSYRQVSPYANAAGIQNAMSPVTEVGILGIGPTKERAPMQIGLDALEKQLAELESRVMAAESRLSPVLRNEPSGTSQGEGASGPTPCRSEVLARLYQLTEKAAELSDRLHALTMRSDV